MNTRVEVTAEIDSHSSEQVQAALLSLPGTKIVSLDTHAKKIVVEGPALSSDVLDKVRSSGVNASIHGIGGASSQGNLGTAVSVLGGKGGWEMGCGGASSHEIGNESVRGIVRFVQSTPTTMIVDSSFSGMVPGSHKIAVHEFGDISEGCNAVGKLFKNGKLGDIIVNPYGIGKMKTEITHNVHDLLGRSVVVSDSADKKLICGIISRAAGVMENTKTICPCTPNETNKPQ
eukprot:Phypoly_transcript_19911.p1 GENE.Phypoly_transcript_19911~~Phypoly_transcript_19911.p1  ORF type:complete len:231 (+),score=30.46 Phypoly_transcript_19911:2-694(+)